MPVKKAEVPLTAFERKAQELKLQPHEYPASAKLRNWAKQNINSVFIPEDLIRFWELTGYIVDLV